MKIARNHQKTENYLNLERNKHNIPEINTNLRDINNTQEIHIAKNDNE